MVGLAVSNQPTDLWKKISEYTVSTAEATITLSSIPTSFKRFMLLVEFKHDAGGGDVAMTLNNDGGNNYYQEYHASTDAVITAAASGARANIYLSSGAAAIGYGEFVIFIGNSSTIYKTLNWSGGYSGAASGGFFTGTGYWASANQVTRIDLITNVNKFDVGTKVLLYGRDD